MSSVTRILATSSPARTPPRAAASTLSLMLPRHARHHSPTPSDLFVDQHAYTPSTSAVTSPAGRYQQRGDVDMDDDGDEIIFSTSRDTSYSEIDISNSNDQTVDINNLSAELTMSAMEMEDVTSLPIVVIRSRHLHISGGAAPVVEVAAPTSSAIVSSIVEEMDDVAEDVAMSVIVTAPSSASEAIVAVQEIVSIAAPVLAIEPTVVAPSSLSIKHEATCASISRLSAPATLLRSSHSSIASSIRSSLSDFGSELSIACASISSSIATSAQSHVELQRKYDAEKSMRVALHNKLLDVHGNIRVFARIRPMHANGAIHAGGSQGAAAAMSSSGANSSNILSSSSSSASTPLATDDVSRYIDARSMGHCQKLYEYDAILPQSCTQQDAYSHVAPFMESVIEGINLSILAFGQTGGGKTFTMDGTVAAPGVNIRALMHIFDLLRARGSEVTWSVKLSSVEIYNESLRDLLVDPSSASSSSSSSSTFGASSASAPPALDVHQSADGSMRVSGLLDRQVSCVADVTECVNNFIKPNRSTAATSMNELSSRSHCLIFLDVQTTSKSTGEKKDGRLVLVDLAGSERTKKSEAVGQSMKEATHINKSLSALGNVMSALASKSAHIPWRSSRLTFLLSDCLGGSSRVIMFACVSPAASDAAESACTLAFATRIRSVQLGPAKVKKSSGALLLLSKAEKELAEGVLANERLVHELRTSREEFQLRGVELTRATSGQIASLERVRQLEAELASTRRVAANASIAAQAAAAFASSTIASQAAQLLKSAATALSPTTLRRRQTMASTTAASPRVSVQQMASNYGGAAVRTTPRHSPRESPRSSISGGLPPASATRSIAAPAAAAAAGHHSRSASDSTSASSGVIASIPLSFDAADEVWTDGAGAGEKMMMDTDENLLTNSDGPDNASTIVAPKRASLTGQKRKDSPTKDGETAIAITVSAPSIATRSTVAAASIDDSIVAHKKRAKTTSIPSASSSTLSTGRPTFGPTTVIGNASFSNSTTSSLMLRSSAAAPHPSSSFTSSAILRTPAKLASSASTSVKMNVAAANKAWKVEAAAAGASNNTRGVAAMFEQAIASSSMASSSSLSSLSSSLSSSLVSSATSSATSSSTSSSSTTPILTSSFPPLSTLMPLSTLCLSEQLCTPTPAAPGTRGVSFGPVNFKFMTPPMPPSPLAAVSVSSSLSSVSTHTSDRLSINSLMSHEALRSKTAATRTVVAASSSSRPATSTSSQQAGSMLGGAKRMAVRGGWNASIK